jgi:putative intracellular protease/amidase
LFFITEEPLWVVGSMGYFMTTRYRNQKKKRTQSFILIGDGFDEFEVICFLHKFRQAGLFIKSISLFNKLVISRQGVGLKADFALAEEPFDPQSDCLLILPSGGRNGDALRRDARVKKLLASMNDGHGRVAVTDGRCHLAEDVDDVLTARPTMRQPAHQALEDFVESLRDQFVFA